MPLIVKHYNDTILPRCCVLFKRGTSGFYYTSALFLWFQTLLTTMSSMRGKSLKWDNLSDLTVGCSSSLCSMHCQWSSDLCIWSRGIIIARCKVYHATVITNTVLSWTSKWLRLKNQGVYILRFRLKLSYWSRKEMQHFYYNVTVENRLGRKISTLEHNSDT